MPQLSDHALGVLCALVSAVAWTFIGFLARALATTLGAVTINMLRLAGAGALLTLVVLATGRLGTLGTLSVDTWIYLSLSVVTAFAIGDTAFFASTQSLGLARAMTLSMAYPLIASLLGLLWLGEPVTPRLASGAVVTLAGLALIVGDRAPATACIAERRRGIRLAVLAAVTWALSVVLMKPALQEIDPVTAQVVRLPLAAAVLWATPWARGSGRRVRAELAATGPRLVLLSGLTAGSAVTFVASLKYADLTLTTVLSSTSPLFALPIGLYLLGEPITPRAGLGAVLTVAGIALIST